MEAATLVFLVCGFVCVCACARALAGNIIGSKLLALSDGQAQFSEVTVHVHGPSVTLVDAYVLSLTTGAMVI